MDIQERLSYVYEELKERIDLVYELFHLLIDCIRIGGPHALFADAYRRQYAHQSATGT
jgi:hypothetical protein